MFRHSRSIDLILFRNLCLVFLRYPRGAQSGRKTQSTRRSSAAVMFIIPSYVFSDLAPRTGFCPRSRGIILGRNGGRNMMTRLLAACAFIGAGTPQHLGAELFKLQAQIDMVHVPFRGALAAIPDVLAGRVHVFIGAINSLLPLIREGKLRALASAGASRIAALPDVPTMAEAGFPGVE